MKLVVLTDGGIWRFYLPSVAETDHGRRFVLELDLMAQAPDATVAELRRYLERGRIASGAFLLDAQAEHGRQRVGVALPEVWRELARTLDRRLIQILTDAVEEKVGVRPKREDVVDFLAKVAHADETPTPKPRRPRRVIRAGRVVILGAEHACANAREAFAQVFRILAERDPRFLERFARDPASRGRKRRYLGRSPVELYPDPVTESLRTTDVVSLPGGWLLGIHLSNKHKRRILSSAARVAGLKLDEDIRIPF